MWQGREPGQQYDEGKGRPVPDFQQDNGHHCDVRVREPDDVDIRTENRAQDAVDRPLLVQQHLKGVGQHDGHGEHGQNEKGIEKSMPFEWPVHQQGKAKAHEKATQRRKTREYKRA